MRGSNSYAASCSADPDSNGVTQCSDPLTNVGTISSISVSTPTPPTVSLTIVTPNMKSPAVSPGEIAMVSTSVIVEVSGAESYNLSLKVNNANIESNGTTLTAGDVISDNTWGYKWDNASVYTAPNTTGKTLADSSTAPLDANGAVEFTKTLTFGAKFGNDANAGVYSASGTLSLVATPRTSTVITLADLTEMQQLSLEEAADACINTPYIKGENYSLEYILTDVRDGREYKVRKLGDGKCWMMENLKISNYNGSNTFVHTGGRYLYPATTDLAGTSSWLLPASNLSSFTTEGTKVAMYYNPYDTSSGATDISRDTSYYTWCAATAGTCSSTTSDGTNATSSICPKGWTLPIGGTGTSTDFWKLFRNMGLTISNGNLTSALNNYTNWGTGDLAIVQGSKYNFAYTGGVGSGSLNNTTSDGYWWSRTANSSTNAYYLRVSSSCVYPGTGNSSRYYGFAVRCVAK